MIDYRVGVKLDTEAVYEVLCADHVLVEVRVRSASRLDPGVRLRLTRRAVAMMQRVDETGS